jgi:hypothetical protein
VFHYVPLGNPTGIYTLNINQTTQPISSDCLELKVVVDLKAAQPHEVTIKAWHPRQKQVNGFTATRPGRGSGTRSYNYHVPAATMDHVTRYANSLADEKIRHEITVAATVVGDPTVSASMGLQLVGTAFDQQLDIDTVHHDFGMSGHRTHITARAASAGRSGNDSDED